MQELRGAGDGKRWPWPHSGKGLTTPRSDTKNGRLAWLDWLRFLAAAVVVFGHSRQAVFVNYGSLAPDYQTLPTMAFFLTGRIGHEMVMVFFALSGFLVGGRLIERVRAGCFNWRQYGIDRFVRIALPLVLAVLFTVGVIIVAGQPLNWLQVVGNILPFQGLFVEPLSANPPLWSLSFEIWFYIIAGAAAFVWTRFNWLALAILAGGLSVFQKLDIGFLLIWCVGAVVYDLRPSRPRTWAVFWLIIFLAGVVLAQLSKRSQYLETIGLNPNIPLIILSISAGFIICCVREFKASERIARWGTVFAASSYTLYLVHNPL